MIEIEGRAKKIKLSSIFNIDAEESAFVNRRAGEGIELTLPADAHKEAIILNMLRTYNRDGDFSSIGVSEKTRVLLEKVIKESTNNTIEEKLKNSVFTFWRNGTTFLVLKILEGEHENVVVKFARPEKDFGRDIAEGYETAKIGLGRDCSVSMTLVDINLRVRDAEGVSRVVFLKNVLVQERVIVLKDVLDILRERKDSIKSQCRIKNIPNSAVQNDPEIKKIRLEEKKIKSDFGNLYKNILSKNIEDKDDGPLAMDRNYGYRNFPLYAGGDYGISDYFSLRRHTEEMNVLGFDFDSIRPRRKNVEIKRDRAPDVFPADINTGWKKILERILVKRA